MVTCFSISISSPGQWVGLSPDLYEAP